MKKVLALVLALVMLGMCGISLAQAQDFVGLWRLTSMVGIMDTVSIEGMAVDMAALGIENEYPMDPAEYGMEMTIELAEGGTGRVSNGVTISQCTWSQEDGVLLIKEGTETLTCQLTQEGFSMEQSLQEGMRLRMNLTRAEGVFEDYVQVVTAPAAVAAQSLAEFNGSWGNSYMIVNGTKYLMSDFGTSMDLTVADGVANVTVAWTPMGSITLTLVDGKCAMDDGTGETGEIVLHEGGVLSMVLESGSVYFEKMQ